MTELEELIDVVRVLRSENGCAWDREQTHESIRRNMLEEAYEAVDAIDDKDINHLKEELGDVLLQVLLHSQIATDNGEFTIEDVAKTLKDKLIYRHPHVFGDVKVNGTQDILNNWDKLKQREKAHRTSVMDGISRAQTALMTAQKASKKAVKVGFEWPSKNDLWDCLYSEIQEFKEAKNFDEQEEELGDMFFAMVNVARWHKIDAEQALLKANKKFIKRFRIMEKLAVKPLIEYSFEEYDELWKNAKAELKKETNGITSK